MFEYKTIRYGINIEYEVGGLVKTGHVLGAIYGQTEVFLKRTLGEDLNSLRGKYVGEVTVSKLTHNEGKTKGIARISVYGGEKSRDTVLAIAAAIREIAQVGPIGCSFTVTGIDNIQPTIDDYMKEKIAQDYDI